MAYPASAGYPCHDSPRAVSTALDQVSDNIYSGSRSRNGNTDRVWQALFLKPRAARHTVPVDGSSMSQEPVDARYLYEQIYNELKQEILSGTYRKGDWFPPERVLKERFNTTHLTVRNALAKLVLDGYIERYSGKGTLVIYSRERAAAPRRTLRFPFAHVILSDLGEPNASLLEALEAQLRKVPLALRFSCHHDDALLAASIHAEAQESGALVILEPAGSLPSVPPTASPVRNTILIRGPAVGNPGPQVVIDDADGAGRAVRRLVELGHRRVAFLTSGAGPSQHELYRGFLAELAARGLPADSGFSEACAPGVDGGAHAVRAILARDPACRAFLCASDETAAGALSGLRDAGLSPGDGCAVVGYGNTRLARAMRLTSIDPGLDRLAERVVATALEGMNRGAFTEELFHITPELCIRDT
jgi:DNA-binding LacI/PurR family transcriptional regulator